MSFAQEKYTLTGKIRINEQVVDGYHKTQPSQGFSMQSVDITTDSWTKVASDSISEKPIHFLMIEGSQPFLLSLSSAAYTASDPIPTNGLFAGFIYSNSTPVQLKSSAGPQTVNVIVGIDTD